jgi:type II secretory pathway pseudopilin PulG
MRRLRLNSTGDTIVEVLICIVIIGAVLTISYGTTRHDSANIEDAQERSQALQIAQRQIELLRANYGSPTHEITSANNCFGGASYTAYTPQKNQQPGDYCVVGSDGQATTGQPAYSINISQISQTAPYEVAITWASLVSSTPDSLTMYYTP